MHNVYICPVVGLERMATESAVSALPYLATHALYRKPTSRMVMSQHKDVNSIC